VLVLFSPLCTRHLPQGYPRVPPLPPSLILPHDTRAPYFVQVNLDVVPFFIVPPLDFPYAVLDVCFGSAQCCALLFSPVTVSEKYPPCVNNSLQRKAPRMFFPRLKLPPPLVFPHRWCCCPSPALEEIDIPVCIRHNLLFHRTGRSMSLFLPCPNCGTFLSYPLRRFPL